MGVAGLWEVLRPAGQVRSLTELAVEDGFNANPSHQRGFRIGIDASIWFFHAAYGREGENPELRTLFFRCCRLLQSPLLPIFVFDGPNRPAVKRGKRIGGNAHWLTEGMKNIIDAFGFEWWVAPGEAEAELAYLNRIGVIDAVLSDDVDNFLFGAIMVIRNPSNSLSGNRANPVKNAQGKDDGNHVVTYTANAILSDPSVALSRSGTILIGLLSGGDYIPAGLPGCGQKFATGLARAGFGDSLLKAVKEFRGARLDAFLAQWRQDIKNELKTNKSGLLPSKKPSLAASLPEDFPSLPVLMSYTDPLTTENSPQKGKRKAPPGVWRDDPDPMRIASLCELYFEWGVKDVIVQRFRTVLWPGIVCRAVRRVVMDKETRRRGNVRRPDSEEEEDTAGPSSPTKRIASALSALALSSPSKKSSTTSTSASDLSTSEPFTLSSLVTLTSTVLPSSSHSTLASGPPPLLLEVLSQRTHVSTDSILEYRVLIDPTTLVERAEIGVKGLRPPLIGGLFGIDEEEDGTLSQEADESGSGDDIERLETAAGAASKSGKKKRKARREVPTTPLRLWLPACMVQAVAPALVQAYEEKVRVREEKKAKRGTRGGRGGRAGTGVKSTSERAKGKDIAEDDDDEVPVASTTKTAPMPKAKPRTVRIGGRRRKPKQASEAQDDAYECINLSAGEGPCSSDGEDVQENTKGKAKAKTARTDSTKRTAKASANTDASNRKATATSTVKDFYATTKPSTVRATRSKPTTARPTAKPSARNPAASKNGYEKEESTDVDVPPPLPKSSRPLDILRAKSRSGTVPVNSTSKSKSQPTVAPGYEESSGSPPPRLSGPKTSASSLPCRSTQPALQARKKPLFVDVSDTDSDIVVSDIRRPSSGATAATTAAQDVLKGGTTASAGVGNILSNSKSHTTRSISTPLMSAPAASLPPEHFSVPPVTRTSTNLVPGVDVGTIGPMPISPSPSKLNHILLPRSPSESEEEKGGELPTFHRGSAKSRAKKVTKAMVCRPAPRPFPMQFTSEAPASPRASRLKRQDESSYGDEDDDDVVEFVDVFTTPRGPSPPRSPTLSPSPAKTPSRHASPGPATCVKPKQSNRFPTSPIKSTSQTSSRADNVKPSRRVSSDRGTHQSGDEKNGIHKSPRKSAAHSSPRHVTHARGRAVSPTPLSHCASPVDNATMLWPSAGEHGALDCPRLQLDGSGSRYAVNGVGPKPRLSDTSVIYISSSEDEDDAQLDVDIGRDDGEAAVYKDRDEWTDQDVNEWADTGMILSAPPSPASDPVPSVPAVEAFAEPARASKFKPAAPTTALKTDARAPSTESGTSGRTIPMNLKSRTHDEDTVTLRPLHRVPLLAARAKQSEGRDDDVIDLTSD